MSTNNMQAIATGQATAVPAISVVMPLYKESLAVLRRTIESLRNQTFTNFELVAVVDNPCHSEAIAMLRDYALQDARVQYVVNSRNLGVWPSYNVGVRKARARYIAIQDADDVSTPDRLQLLYDYLEQHPDVDVVGAGLRYVDEATGRELMCRRYPERAETAIKRYCPIAHGTTLRRACAHERYGYYSESPDVRHAADYELWCRWQADGAVMRNHPAIVYHYQQSPLNFKANNVRGILRDTVRIKWRYARTLRFSLCDYIYLTMESAAVLLPTSVIVWMFYQYNRIRAASTAA